MLFLLVCFLLKFMQMLLNMFDSGPKRLGVTGSARSIQFFRDKKTRNFVKRLFPHMAQKNEYYKQT